MKSPAGPAASSKIFKPATASSTRLIESKSRPDVDIVTVKTIGYNQDGEIVISFTRTLLVYRRGKGPSGKHRPQPKIAAP